MTTRSKLTNRQIRGEAAIFNSRREDGARIYRFMMNHVAKRFAVQTGGDYVPYTSWNGITHHLVVVPRRDDPVRLLKKAGFYLWNSGGGHECWRRDTDGGDYVLVTDDQGEADATMAGVDGYIVGFYDGYDSEEQHVETFDDLSEGLRWALGGER